MGRAACIVCQHPLSVGLRKYCLYHSKLASAIWKRAHRRLWKAAGDSYWLSDWKNRTTEERRAYFRSYMRDYRRRIRASNLVAKCRK